MTPHLNQKCHVTFAVGYKLVPGPQYGDSTVGGATAAVGRRSPREFGTRLVRQPNIKAPEIVAESPTTAATAVENSVSGGDVTVRRTSPRRQLHDRPEMTSSSVSPAAVSVASLQQPRPTRPHRRQSPSDGSDQRHVLPPEPPSGSGGGTPRRVSNWNPPAQPPSTASSSSGPAHHSMWDADQQQQQQQQARRSSRPAAVAVTGLAAQQLPRSTGGEHGHVELGSRSSGGLDATGRAVPELVGGAAPTSPRHLKQQDLPAVGYSSYSRYEKGAPDVPYNRSADVL